MPTIPDNFIDDLIQRVDLNDLIGRYISLKKTGSRFMGVCPFHGDTNPSLSVDPERKMWYCFGCQAGGDAITFIRKQEGLEFVEAVNFIARLYGIPVPEGARDPGASRRKTIIDVNDASRDIFIKVLKSKHGRYFRDYLTERGFTRETAEVYRVGASVNTWDFLSSSLLKKGFKEDDLVEAGVSLKKKSGSGLVDRFRGRLMIPIIDPLDRTLGFGARAMGDDSPKYLNSPENQIFQKSKILFGLDLAKNAVRKSSQLILMEGYTDVMHAHQAGIENCCAVMGTALTREHLPLIARYAGEVTLSFDGDEAGIRATTKSIMEFAGSDFTLKVLTLPLGVDPADIITSEGPDKFRKRVSNSVEASRWLFKTYGDPVRDQAISARLKAFENVAGFLGAFQSHPAYDGLEEQAAIAFNLNTSIIRDIVSQRKTGSKSLSTKALENIETMLKDNEQIERTLFLSLMSCPEHLPEIKNHLDPEDFDHPLHRRLARIIFQPGFSIGTPHNLQKLREVTDDDELYSYVVKLLIDFDEDHEAEDKPQYTEDVLKPCLACMLKKQFETESKRLQSAMTELKARNTEGDPSDDWHAGLLDLMKEKQELETDFREILYELGGEKLLTEDDLKNPEQQN
ncbi:MAG: DNA primase [bacterium]|nr:DNA primase [bacterium]